MHEDGHCVKGSVPVQCPAGSLAWCACCPKPSLVLHSPSTVPEGASQRMVRPSLPQDSSSAGSCGHQLAATTPCRGLRGFAQGCFVTVVTPATLPSLYST